VLLIRSSGSRGKLSHSFCEFVEGGVKLSGTRGKFPVENLPPPVCRPIDRRSNEPADATFFASRVYSAQIKHSISGRLPRAGIVVQGEQVSLGSATGID
jgi:hypothetical protein